MPSTLTRWDPLGELTELRSRFDRAFEDLTDGRERAWTLAIDAERDNGNLVIHAELPGIKPEDVKIEAQDDILTVSGKHEQDAEQKHKHYVRRERRYGSFSRSIALPPGVDANQIDAKIKHGIVEVTIPLPKHTNKKPVTIKPTAG